MSRTLNICVLVLGDECVSLSLYVLFRQWKIFSKFHSKMFSCLIVSLVVVPVKTIEYCME